MLKFRQAHQKITMKKKRFQISYYLVICLGDKNGSEERILTSRYVSWRQDKVQSVDRTDVFFLLSTPFIYLFVPEAHTRRKQSDSNFEK